MTLTAPPLASSADAAARAGLHPHLIQRWQLEGAICATQPPTGTGSHTRWSASDVACLEAIARVRAGLTLLGLPCPHTLVAKLWDDLVTWGEADLVAGPVTISVGVAAPVRLGLEDE